MVTLVFFLFRRSTLVSLHPSTMAVLQFWIGPFLYICSAFRCTSSILTDHFKPQLIETTWITSDAKFSGRLTIFECAQRCLVAAEKCYAFHLASDNKCYIVEENKNWMEQRPLQTVKFWVKQMPPVNRCRTPMFPESFNKSRYYYEKTNLKNWNDAAVFCESLGGRLAQISTDAERRFLGNLINPPISDNRVLLGAYKNRDDGLPHNQGWRWRGSGEPFISSFWSSGQPDNADGNQFCVMFWKDLKYLNDVEMNEAERFICECTTL